MPFNENLQVLRSRRNMTQEQLAMLVGVSRQAISKWESGKAYPEMDKLLIMCDLFGTTLDDLVIGDVTQSSNTEHNNEANSADRNPYDQTRSTVGVPPTCTTPPQDVTGYDEHMLTFRDRIANGVNIIILGVALSNLFDDHNSILGNTNPYNDVAMFMCIMLGVVAGCALIIPAGLAHSTFMRRHPFVEDFYTEADRAAGQRTLVACIIAGLALVFTGIGVNMIADEVHHISSGWPIAGMLACIAFGVWCFIYGGLTYARLNIAVYNQKSETAATFDFDWKHENRYDQINAAICGVIMIIATIIGLTLLLGFDGGPNDIFWLSWVIGGLLCGISSVIMEAVKATHR